MMLQTAATTVSESRDYLWHLEAGRSIGKTSSGDRDFPYMSEAGRFQTCPPVRRSGLVALTRFATESIAEVEAIGLTNSCLYS